jgi:hypothetical protein
MSEKPKTPTNVNQPKDSWKGELQIKPGPGAAQLSNQEISFCEAYVGNGGDAKAAATAAGYEDPGAAVKLLLADPRIRELVEVSRDTDIKTAGATRAWAVMNELMTDPSSPAQVKFQAARWTLEASGHGLSAVAASLQLGLKQSGKQLHQMSVKELEEFVRSGRATFDNLKSAVKAGIPGKNDVLDLEGPKK